MSRKSTSTPKIAIVTIFTALAFTIFSSSPATSSESQNITELEAEMQHLQNILEQMDNGTLNRSYNIEAITAENYSCNSTGYETSKVMTEGKHHLMFGFGDDVGYANNLAFSANVTNPPSPPMIVQAGTANQLFNFSVNNTDATKNVTQVQIILPSNFTYISSSNGTGAIGTIALGSGGNYTPSGESQALWQYRKAITINGSTSEQTNYQVMINLTSDNFNFSRANSEGNDTRFTWLNGSTEQNITFWIENWTSSGSLGNATLWVKIPNVTALANTTIYMYYRNPSTTYNNTLGGNNTFDTFYDLRGLSSLPSGWQSSGTVNYYSNGISVTAWGYAVTTASTYGNVANRILDEYIVMPSSSSGTSWYSVGFVNNAVEAGHKAVSHALNSGGSYGKFESSLTSSGYNGLAYGGSGVVSMRYDSSTAYYYKNYAYLGSYGTSVPTVTLNLGINNNQQQGVANTPAILSWIRVRKYASPEPSVLSVGAEEQGADPTWSNTTASGFIQNGTTQYFWLNASVPSSTGTYSFNITTLDTAGVSNSTLVNVSVVSSLTVNIASQQALGVVSGTNVIQQSQNFTVSVYVQNSTGYPIDSVWVNITNSTGYNFTYFLDNQSAKSISGTWSKTINISALGNSLGTYNISFYANDTLGLRQQSPVPTAQLFVETILLTEYLSPTTANPGDNVTVSGRVTLQPDGIGVANNPISIYLDGDVVSEGGYTPAGESQALWQYRREIIINGSTAEQTDYQVNLLINSSNVGGNFNWSTYGNDTRFTWLNGSTEQNVSFWIEYWNNATAGNNASLWVKIPNVTALSNTIIYMYYGNSSATYNNSLGGNNTFIFFDDFGGGLSKWSNHGGSAITGGWLQITGTGVGTWTNGVDTVRNFQRNSTLEFNFKIITQNHNVLGFSDGGWQGVENVIDEFYIDPSNNLNRRSSGGTTDGNENQVNLNTVLSTGTLYKAKIELKQTGANYYFDTGNGYVSNGSTSTYSTAPAYIMFDVYDTGVLQYDNVRIRKYTSIEPSVLSVGAERAVTETNSTGGYNYTFTAPLTAGNHPVKVNLTDGNGIYGENSTNLTVRINISSPNVSVSTPVNPGTSINISVNVPTSNINYPTLNLSQVWANVSWSGGSQLIFLNGSVSGGVWWNASTYSLGAYNVTFYANLTDGFSTTTAANATFSVKQLNITYAINDSAIYATESSLINGTIYLEPEHAVAGTPVQGTVNSGNLTMMSWWNISWQYRKAITINGSATNLSDYQVLVNLTSSNFNFSKANSQGNDTRFTWLNTTSGLEQNISFWIENWTSSGANGNATIWVKVPNVTALANTTLYMYYGNPSATYNNSLGRNSTFNIFDDFNDGTKDTALFTWTGTTAESSGYATVTGSSSWNANKIKTVTKLLNVGEMAEIRYHVDITNSNTIIAAGNNTGWVSTGEWGVGIGSSGNLQIFVAGVLQYDSGVSAYSTNDWVKVRVWRKDSSNMQFWTLKEGTNPDYVSRYNGAATTTDANALITFLQTYQGTPDADYILVRKYASPVPSMLSVGVEQTASTTDTNSIGAYAFTYTPNASITSVTTVTLTLNATDSNSINGTATNSSAITIYPAIAVDTWASTTSACSDRTSIFNITSTKFLCANVTYGISNTAGAYVNFSVSDISSYAYGPANPVFTNNSLYDSGTIVWSPMNLSESTKYRVTATAWNPSVNALVTATDTYDFNYGQLNFSANLSDTIVMPDANITVIGQIFDYFSSIWTRINTFVRIFLDGVELTNGGHYSRTWATNANFSNGTSVNTTNISNYLALDPRGQYYFEAENYFAQANITNQTNDNPSWDGEPSGGKYIGSTDIPSWAQYNITGIPNGTYYLFLKMYVGASDNMVNVTWDGAYINTTQRSAGYLSDILWTDSLAVPVTVNATSHILGINSTTSAPSVDVILLTTNPSFATNNTDQNYTSTPLKYRGYFTSNKTTADYAIISITPNWTSDEPSGSNITIDISANNGTSWCSNVTKREYRANESCGAIGAGTELVWRANLSTNNSLSTLHLINVTMLYETGNTTKTNSSGFFSFLFNALKTLGWHNITINVTDSDGISGNISLTYLVDNLTITTDTTPNVIDADAIAQTITATINSNAGRVSGTRKNITATIINPDATQDIIANSSFSCSNNYPMTCTASWSPGVQPPGFYNVTIDFEDNESITGTNTTYNDFNVDNITTTISSSDIAPVIAKNITISGTAGTNSTSVLAVANITLATSSEVHSCGYNTSMSGTQYAWTMNCSISSAEYSDELGPANVTVRINDTTGNVTGINTTSITIWAPAKVNRTANDYVVDMDEGSFNITGYYWRTDVLSTIPGEINITINGISKACSGAASCLKNFTLGQGQDISSTGIYTVTINASNNSAYYMPNSTQFNVVVENITTTIYTNKSQYLIGESIFINGTAQQSVNGLMASGTLNLTIDGNPCGTSGWAGAGIWNTSCAIGSGTYSSNLGPATVFANITNQTDWIYGQNATSIEIWAPTKVNYTNATSYAGTNTEYNITGYYWRTDVLGAIPGTINITVFNSTYSITKSCSGATSCLKNFTIGPSGELAGGNYTVYVNASNNSAYYMPNSTQYSLYLEEPKAIQTLNAPVKVIADFQQGIDYNYTQTVTLNNSNTATAFSPRIDYNNGCAADRIKAILNATPKDCSAIAPNATCTVQFNITVSGDAPQGQIGCLSWNASWTNNDNTAGSTTNTAFYIDIWGNPKINASVSLINVTDYLGSANTTLITINNTGNALLGAVGVPSDSIFVDLVNSTLPLSWISFSSTAGVWNDANDYWDYLTTGNSYMLNATITAGNYSSGTYSGIINITSYSSGALQTYAEINVSVTISPNITISQNRINHTQFIGSPNITNITVLASGNSPITNVTATYIAETMPASWINLSSLDSAWNSSSNSFSSITEYTNKTFTVNITVLNYTPGTYTGKINITTNENLNRIINVSVTVSPAVSANISIINTTQNISSANTTLVSINSIGNAPLTNVTIMLVNSTIPQSWVSLSSTASDWDSGAKRFLRIDEATNRTLNITIKAINYTEGTYTGILNITSNESIHTSINLSITITPNAATYNINRADEHGRTIYLYHIINSTGNAPLINATATYIESTLNASWITLNFSGQSGQSVTAGNITEGAYKNVTVRITIPEFQDPGTYTGYINTTFDNEPRQQITVTLTVNTNSSWHLDPPANRSNTFVLGQAGVIGNVTIANTGNVPLNYTILYTYNGVCQGNGAAPYYCTTGALSAGHNNASVYVPKNSSRTWGIWQKGDSSTETNAEIIVNATNSSGTPIYELAYMSWNITNSPPALVNLTTLPKGYVELNKSTALYAVISDDEALSGTKGLNMTSVYFNVTTPTGYTYTINNDSIYAWTDNDYVPPEADRRKFNYSFANTSMAGIHNLTVYIKDKSGNEINRTIFQFEVIGATSINISAANPSTATNITYLHGENLTVPINITNIGRAAAYNITITGAFPNGIVWNRTYSELNESQAIQTNVTITVALATSPGTYQFAPKVVWAHPNTSQEENTTAANATVTVASKYEITMASQTQASMNHGEQKTLTLEANATGNVDYSGTPYTYIIAGTAPMNWTCFNNYCASGGVYAKSQATVPRNTTRAITAYLSVPQGTAPGNYTFGVKFNSTNDPAGSTTNITITVPEDRSWTYSRPYNMSSFELNTPGTIGIITLNGSGNIETNFTIAYSNWSAADYHAYPGLINESQNNSGTVVNPTSVILQPNEIRNISIYQNGYFQGASNIGINVTISNSSASPAIQSILLAFNLTETAPNITAITFFNASYVELNKTIGIKILARDDAALNLSTIRLNITSPAGSSITVTPDATAENQTAYGKYIRMNFTYLFNATTIAGNYTVNATVSDEYGYVAQSFQYMFEAVGATTFNLSSNASAYNVSGITQAAGRNITIFVNASNTGRVSSYNATLGGNMSANASAWIVYGVTLGNISSASNASGNVTIQIPEKTWPGTYYFTPKITWTQPNGSAGEYYSGAMSISVASNRTTVFSEYALNYTISHGATNSTQIRINSTGNDNATSIILWKQNVPSNLTVSLNQTTISGIPAGESRYVTLNITPAPGTPNGTYTFDIQLDNDGSAQNTYSYAVIVPASFSWQKSANETTVNGVSGQNAVDTSINITNTGNNQITYTLSLSGNVSDASIMNLLDTSKTLQPLQTYSVRLNHTAKNENAYYEGTLQIMNGSYYEEATIKYYSYIAELNIVNISPNYNLISGNSVNVTTQLLFGANNITENTTYAIYINGTSCTITQNTTSGGYITHTCTAPAISDGKYYDIRADANYLFQTGTVPLTKTNASAIYYKDVTAPNISSHIITSEQEILNNVTLNLTAQDNIQISGALAEIKYPNETAYSNITLSNTSLANYSTIFTAPQTIGTYTATYYVNDTTGNTNSSVQDTFEIYEWKNFSGIITDLNSNPVSVSFNVTNSSGQNIALFSTNASGNYNVTLKKKTYNLRMDVLNSTIELENIDFAALSSDFIDIDQPMTGDYGFQGTVIKGFAINTSLSTTGNITMTYTAAEASGLTTDYFQIYRCLSWDYSNRNCAGGLSKITSTHDKVNRKLKASLPSLTTFLLVEDQPVTRPEMTIAASALPITVEHGKKDTGYLTIQSTGTVALSDIQFTCNSGTACTDFTFAASSIIGLDAGASYDAPVNITVPKYYAPGTYEGIITVESNKLSVYAQYKALTLRVAVPENSNWTASTNISLSQIGSSTSGTAGNIELKNNANVPISFTVSTQNASNIGITPAEITVAKNNTDYIAINYTTPRSVNFYNYSINITGTGNSSLNSSLVYLGMNVTHAINITSIQPNSNISMGQMITINATASYLDASQTNNMSWEATIDGTPCTSTTSSYNITNWMLVCEAPNMSAKLSYNLKLKGTFLTYNGQIAYDSAYDQDNIYYVDVLPPQIANYTSGTEQTSSNVTINVTLTDYSNITNASVTLIAPNGTVLSTLNLTNIQNNTYMLQYNFTEIGDYILRYYVSDSLGNAGTEDKYFEVYRNMSFSGKVAKSDESGLQTTFKLYRQNQNYSNSHLLQQFTTDSNGNYNKTVHYRNYDLEVGAENHAIKLYNINLTNFTNDPIDIDTVAGNEVQITGTTELGGIAVNTTMESAGRITIAYVPGASTKEDNIYLYRCADWNFTDVACEGTWEKLERQTGDLDKISNKISSDITGFSAYIAAEVTPPLPVDITGSVSVTTTSSGGGGGGGGADVSGAISDIKQRITSLIEGTSEFSVDTKSISKQLYPGERVSISLGVKNGLNNTARITAKVTGELSNFTTLDTDEITLDAQKSGAFSMEIFVPKTAYPGNYEGKIIINNGKVDTVVPVSVRILDTKTLPISVDIQPLVDKVAPGATARVKLSFVNTGATELPVNYTVTVVDPITGVIVSELTGSTTVVSTESFYLNLSIPKNITLESPIYEGLSNVRTKRYMIKATAYSADPGRDIKAEMVSFISVTEEMSVWKVTYMGIPLWMIIELVLLSISGYAIRKRYLIWASSKKKYAESIDFKTLPQATDRSGFIGKIAETEIRAFIDFDTLQTHTVVAGSTGGGKTVAAQVIVEEALLKGVAVIVFDPTAQWSGFLRPNRDKRMLKIYRNFDMKVADSRPFNGNIYEIRDPRQIIDITKYMTPGEITVFTLNHLDTKDIDFFVANTVKQVFQSGLEGSQKLKLLIAYDEVHRLLEKYGGTGQGFLQIERAVREFRKWGIGLILISQVLSDFVGTIKANIGTDIQLRTRDENDLERIKMKYGEDMMRSIVKAAVGEGMVENAQYNKGKPYFVAFRPLLHGIERLSDAELEKYSKYNTRIDELKYQLECLKSETVDVFDLELELKLALENLMKGNFNMVDIYLEELEPKVSGVWKKLGREPKRRVIAYATRDEIEKEVERAKKEREDYIAIQKMKEPKEKKAAASVAESAKATEIADAPREKEKAADVSHEAPHAKGTRFRTFITRSNIKPHTHEGKKKEELHKHPAKPDKKELESIKAAVIRDMRDRAKKEDLKAGVKSRTVGHESKKDTESDNVEQLAEEVKELYDSLKAKISEDNKKGRDTSVVSLKAMSIPSSIKLAVADDSVKDLEKIRDKINTLIKST